MPDQPFVGRKAEIDILRSQWVSHDAEFMILYGRRRVGKTRLITHFLESTDPAPRSIYWVAEPTSSAAQLQSFSQAILAFETGIPQANIDVNFSYGNWRLAFEAVASLAKEKRLLLVLDEFTYLMAVSRGIAGTLQNAWDHQLKKSNIFLIISGSHLGMMERETLMPRGPLYGRATSKLKLEPLPFKDTSVYFPNYRTDERVAVYALFGGIPHYWEQFNPNKKLNQNIREALLSRENLFFDEPHLLLHDFVSEIGNYASILRAIAHGYRTPTEIASVTSMASPNISMYLKNLIDTRFIERRVPVTQSENSRFGRHYITDPFLRFYYRFLAGRQSELARGITELALAEFKQHLIDFIGTHTWEELCREWLQRSVAHKVLPFVPDKVGSEWNRSVQIDVAGINWMEKTLILGECKWGRKQIDQDALEKLIEGADQVVPSKGSWRVYFIGFARDGWTSQAQKFASSIKNGQVGGANWQAEGMLLRTLEQVDKELRDWTE